jgi:hypothetical protein
LGKPTGSPGKLERGAFPQYWLFPANPRCRAVNRKDREFVVGLFGSPNRTRTYDLLVDGGETQERPSLRAHKQKSPPLPEPGGRVGGCPRYRLIRYVRSPPCGFTAVGNTLADVKEFAALVRWCERTGSLERLSEMHPASFESRMQTTWGGNWYRQRQAR